MKRTGEGFGREDGGVISGSNNAQNARPDLEFIYKLRSNKTPLWPTTDSSHDNCLPVIRGEIAFGLKPVTDMESFETIGRKRFGANNVGSAGGFNETRDTVSYLTTLNGMGSTDMEKIYGSRDQAQLSYRHKINFYGFVRDSILKNHNEIDLGNTLVVSKGKISIPNTGKSEISQGMSISWDIPLTSLIDQKVYGLSKCGSFEPGRVPLLTEPTQTAPGLVDELTKELCDFRNTAAREEVRRYWKGLAQASIGIDFQFAVSSKTGYPSDIPRLEHLSQNNNVPAIHGYTVEELIRTKALASVDDDDVIHMSTIMKNTDHQMGLLNSSEKRRVGLQYLTTPIVQLFNVLNEDPTTDYYQSVCERGTYDILMSIMGCCRAGYDRKIGTAVTDAIPGNYFDIVL